MQVNEVKVFEAEGLILANDIELKSSIIKKGTKLSSSNISSLKLAGLETISCYKPNKNDIDAKTAIGMVAAAITGNNTAYILNDDGYCHIFAEKNGIIDIDEVRINRFNNSHPDIFINTIKKDEIVKKDDLLAVIRIIPYLINIDEVNNTIHTNTGQGSLISVADFNIKTTTLIQTTMPDTEEQLTSSTKIYLEELLLKADCKLKSDIKCEHNSEDIANSIYTAINQGAEFIIISPAKPTYGKSDIIPTALKESAIDIYKIHIPVETGFDTILAYKGKRIPVIQIPHNYHLGNNDTINKLICKLISKQKFNIEDITQLGFGSLSIKSNITNKTKSELLSGTSTKAKGKSTIAAIILAAGRGTRMGGNNKLLHEINDEPLFLQSIKSALKSKASPIIVVTGFEADRTEEYLRAYDVVILRNTGYKMGIKTSIDLALSSLPHSVDGALLIPADMPGITTEHIDKLIKSFKPNKKEALCISEFEGVKKNPILWPRNLFADANLIPDNSHLRPVFLEHTDYTKAVKTKNELDIIDINTPGDLIDYSKKVS